MRIVIFAQKPIGEKCFDFLVGSETKNIELVGACSNKDALNTWWETANISNYCSKNSIPFLASEEAGEINTQDFISQCRADVLISIQHPKLISKKTIDLVKGQAFNLHLAPLPEYKGYYGINHAILNEEKIYKSTIHWMNEKADDGDIAYESTIPISKNETALSLYRKAETAGFKIFLSLINNLNDGITPPSNPQNGSGYFYSNKSLSKLKNINLPIDIKEVEIKARAFHFPPFEPAYILINGIKIGLVYIDKFTENNQRE